MDSSTTQQVREHQRALALQYIQRANARRTEFEKFKTIIKKPSALIYSLFIYFAICADLLSWAETVADHTIILLILSISIDIALGFMFMVVYYYLGRQIKRSGEVRQQFEEKLVQIRQANQNISKALKLIKNTSAGRIVRNAKASGLKQLRKASKSQNPIIRGIATQILAAIPYVEVIPWETIAAIWTYLDHRNEYRAVQELIPEYESQLQQLEEAEGEELQQKQKVIAQAAEQEFQEMLLDVAA